MDWRVVLAVAVAGWFVINSLLYGGLAMALAFWRWFCERREEEAQLAAVRARVQAAEAHCAWLNEQCQRDSGGAGGQLLGEQARREGGEGSSAADAEEADVRAAAYADYRVGDADGEA